MTNKEEAKIIRECVEKLSGLPGDFGGVTRALTAEADSLDPPRLNVIPEGTLCWGWRNDSDIVLPSWQPCVATGIGSGENAGVHYSKIRLIHPDHWPKDRKYCVLWKDQEEDFWRTRDFLENPNVVYYEVNPNARA